MRFAFCFAIGHLRCLVYAWQKVEHGCHGHFDLATYSSERKEHAQKTAVQQRHLNAAFKHIQAVNMGALLGWVGF